MLYIIAILLMVGGTGFATWNITSTYYEAKQDKLIAEAVAGEATKRADIATKMAALEREKAVVREVEVVKWKTIKKEVERVVKGDPVYVSLECRVTDDGVRLFNAAAAGLQLAAADVRPAVVPEKSAAPEARGDNGRPAGNSGGGLRPVPRV